MGQRLRALKTLSLRVPKGQEVRRSVTASPRTTTPKAMSSKLTLPGAEAAQGVAQGVAQEAECGAVSRAACAAAGHGVHYG